MILLLLLQIITQVGGNTLIDGTYGTWTNGQYTWAGNPYCVGPDFNFTLQSNSDAIDAGVFVEGLHCPAPGPGPAQNVGECKEWYGAAPDIGACEFIPAPIIVKPVEPTNLGIQVQ
jgi:hypothetical protein